MCLQSRNINSIRGRAKGPWKWFLLGFQDHDHRQISGNKSGVATETSIFQGPCSCGAYFLARWVWGAGKSLSWGLEASLLKNDLSWRLKMNQNEPWLLSIQMRLRLLTWKDRVLYLGPVTAKWLVHKRTWTISLFSRNICGLSSEKSGKDTFWLIKTERLGMLARKGKRNTHWMIVFFCFLYIKD